MKNGSASERSERRSATGNSPSRKPEALAVERQQVDAGQVRLGGDPALGERRDHRVAVGAVGELDDVDEPAAPLVAAVGAGQHEAGGIALAGGAPERGEALAVERGDPRAPASSSSSALELGDAERRLRPRSAGS